MHLVKAGTNTRKPQSLDVFSIRGENSQSGSSYFVSNYMFQMKRLGLCALPPLSSWLTVQTALCFWIGYVATWKNTKYRNWPVNHVVRKGFWKWIGLWVLLCLHQIMKVSFSETERHFSYFLHPERLRRSMDTPFPCLIFWILKNCIFLSFERQNVWHRPCQTCYLYGLEADTHRFVLNSIDDITLLL